MPTQPADHIERAGSRPARPARSPAASPPETAADTQTAHLQRTFGNAALARRAGVVQRTPDPDATRASIASIAARVSQSGPAPALIQRKWTGGGGFYTEDRNGSTYDANTRTFTGPPSWTPVVKDARAHERIMANIRKDVPEEEGNAQPQQEEQQAPAWTYVAGDLFSSAKSNVRDDLVTLSGQIGGAVARNKIGTLVGGIAIKSKDAKKVAGLNNPSARIDLQNPPKRGTYNLQYQIGTKSYAGVLFVGEDSQDEVLAQLVESFDRHQMAHSPAYEQT